MKKKILVLTLAAVLLVVAAVGGTLAYLTSTAQVKNTFTVGKVVLTLDEAKTDEYGVVVNTGARVETNTYKLIPGHSYIKDPTIHFAPGSESSYLFVKVENGISALESKAAGMSIAAQLTANGWTLLTGQTNVYCKETAVAANTGTTAVDYKVFGTFTIDGDANLSVYSNANAVDLPKLDVTAYAVQADGFDSAADAWAATYGKQFEPNNH